MATVVPHSELLQRAVVYVNDTRGGNPKKKLPEILDEACMRFNLSPLDGEALHRLFSPEPAAAPSEKAD